MKHWIVFSGALLLAPAALLAQLSVPTIGVARYADHTLRGISGLEANLLVDSQSISRADAVSFSDIGGLIASAGKIQLITLGGVVVGEFDSNESALVLNIDGALTTAIAWLPSHSAVVYWNGSSFQEARIYDISGTVTSVQLAGTGLVALLTNDASGNVFQVSVSLASGNVVSMNQLAGMKGPAIEHSGFIVSEGPNELEIRASDGSIRTLPLSAPALTFERMSSEWLHVSSPTTHQDWALHLTSKALQLSILPAAPMAGGSQMRHAQEVQR
jgi:hypothetical protein